MSPGWEASVWKVIRVGTATPAWRSRYSPPSAIPTEAGQGRTAWPAGQSIVCDSPPGPVIVRLTVWAASGRHRFTSDVVARQKVPLWVESTCQIVGLLGTRPALRTAPIRARRPSAVATVRELAWTA